MTTALANKLTWEDIKEISDVVTAVSLMDEVCDIDLDTEEKFYSYVIDRICNKYKTESSCRRRYNELLPVAENIIGEKCRKERTFNQAILRTFVASQLRKEEYSWGVISKVMGYNHSTIIYYTRKLEEMKKLPMMWEKELNMYERFKEEISK